MVGATMRLPMDPVRDTQATFRVLLEALARPGLVGQLPTRAEGTPGNPWVGAVLLTLLDHETTLHAAAPDLPLADFVRQRSAAPTAPPEGADIVFATASTAGSELDVVATAMKRGTLSYPDDSATLVIAVNRLEQISRGEDAAGSLVFSGPGVSAGCSLTVSGLAPSFLEARAAAVKDYPKGIDVVLVDVDGRVAGLPRSTRVATAVGQADRQIDRQIDQEGN